VSNKRKWEKTSRVQRRDGWRIVKVRHRSSPELYFDGKWYPIPEPGNEEITSHS
jgi:hypothetical protein